MGSRSTTTPSDASMTLLKRWEKLVERVSAWKRSLDRPSAALLERFYQAQDANFQADLQSGFLGVWVGFADSEAVDQSTAFDDTASRNGGEVHQLGKRNLAKVKLVKFPRGNGFVSKQLWVDPTYKDYNAAYKDFAKQEFGFSIARNYGDYLNVDHVFNHARAEVAGLSFVRLALVDADVNQMWGGEYENAATASVSGPVTGVRFASDLLLAKTFRIHPPPTTNGLNINDADLQEFIERLEQAGISGPQEVLAANVRLALNKAASGAKSRRVFAADWDRKVFYFVMDFPMSPDDYGPDWVRFDLDGAGRDLTDLTAEQVAEAKSAVTAWVSRNFSYQQPHS